MAMVEMVFVLPVLLMILFGIVEMGVMLGRWQTVTNSAREGAREAIVFRQSCNAGTLQSDITTVVQSYCASANITIDPTDVQVTGLCAGAGTNATVQVTFPFRFQVLGGLVPGLGPTLDLASTSVMRNEGSS